MAGSATWLGKYPILDESHIHDLEARAAVAEFEKLMPREHAEQEAHKQYLMDHHLAGAAHHYAGMRAARGAGDAKAAEKHSTMYEAHMRRAGEDPYSSVPDKVRHLADNPTGRSLYRFKDHDADEFALGDRDPEDYSDTSEDHYEDVDDVLHKAEPGSTKKLVGKRVSVHWNGVKQTWSVKHRGRVVAHVDQVRLRNAKFRVSKKGRTRALKGSRVGHAHVSGTVASHAPEHTKHGVTYNPHKHSTFVTRHDGKAIHRAKTVHMTKVAIPGVSHGHRPRVSVEHSSEVRLAKGDVVQFPGVKIPGKKNAQGPAASVTRIHPEHDPKRDRMNVWKEPAKFPPGGPKHEYRRYRCTACGYVQRIGTNHLGPVQERCSNCSWRGVGFTEGDNPQYKDGPGMRRFEYVEGAGDEG